MEINSSKQCEVELHDLASPQAGELSTGIRFHVLLVADAPVDVLVSDHR